MPATRRIRRYSDYDAQARDVLVRAGNLAQAQGSASVGTAHLLLGVISSSPELAAALAEQGIVEEVVAGLPPDEEGASGLTQSARSVFGAAEAEALRNDRHVVMVGDLLAGLSNTPSPVSLLLAAARSRDIDRR